MKKSVRNKPTKESKALERFNLIFERGRQMVINSKALFILTESMDGKIEVKIFNQSKPHYSDMCRSGIVMVVAAFDTYFTYRLSDAIIPYIKKKGVTKKTVSLLEGVGMDLEFALNLLQDSKRPNRRIRTLVEATYLRETTQNFDVIDKFFLSLGIKNFSDNVQAKVNRKTLKRSITKLIRRRNAIAHDGDLSRNGLLSDVNPDEILKKMDQVRLFVRTADTIVASVIK
jgi:hypothetical protein